MHNLVWRTECSTRACACVCDYTASAIACVQHVYVCSIRVYILCKV